MADDRDLADMVQNATLAADPVAAGHPGTSPDATRAIVERAVGFLLGNGIIEVKPRAEWPEWLVLDPPFRTPGPTERPVPAVPRDDR